MLSLILKEFVSVYRPQGYLDKILIAKEHKILEQSKDKGFLIDKLPCSRSFSDVRRMRETIDNLR